MAVCRTLSTVAALLVIACGPSRSASGSSESETGSSTASDATETANEVDTDTDEFPMFAAVPDEWTKYPCDSVLQDCPAGEKCVPYSSTGGNWDALKCVPVLGDQAPGEPCTWDGIIEATDNCDQNGACWDVMDVDGEAIGTCQAFCFGNPNDPDCSEGDQCRYLGQSQIAFCYPQCDPLAQDCGAGLGCYWVDEFTCVFTTEDLSAGEPCGFANDCAAGLACLDAALVPACAGATCCAPFCDINLGVEQCAAVPGTGCVPFFAEGMAPASFADVGVCVQP